mmetsp:Transcript_34913/g.87957  ORF Transcript_34913/g.87957 Transcript_34913/m.87957 type:complete len:118 (-) Transcript_34913:14-367(-)
MDLDLAALVPLCAVDAGSAVGLTSSGTARSAQEATGVKLLRTRHRRPLLLMRRRSMLLSWLRMPANEREHDLDSHNMDEIISLSGLSDCFGMSDDEAGSASGGMGGSARVVTKSDSA